MKNLHVEFHEHWTQFFSSKQYNWLTFWLLHFSFEWDRSMGELEIEMGILGLTARITYLYNSQAEARLQVEKKAAAFLAGSYVAVAHAEYAELKEKAAKWDEKNWTNIKTISP